MPGLLCDGQVWAAQKAVLAQYLPVAVADYSLLSSIERTAEKVLSDVPGPIVAIGHSMGGRVALEMVHRAELVELADPMREMVMRATPQQLADWLRARIIRRPLP
jgi:pimeloyl-ACP methyl ester carboxylesterase